MSAQAERLSSEIYVHKLALQSIWQSRAFMQDPPNFKREIPLDEKSLISKENRNCDCFSICYVGYILIGTDIASLVGFFAHRHSQMTLPFILRTSPLIIYGSVLSGHFIYFESGMNTHYKIIFHFASLSI